MNDPQQQNDYTDQDIRIRPLVIFLAVTLIITVATFVFVKYLFDSYDAQEQQQTITTAERLMEASRPTNAVVEGLGEAQVALKQYRSYVDDKLNHLRWIDKDAGIVQLPIAVAMQQRVAAGLPVRKSVEAAASANADETPVQAGQRLFAELGCIACHGDVSGMLGPSLTGGVIGREVQLVDGTKFIADETYLRNSILNSSDQIVAGYAPVMPNFNGLINPDQLDKLVAYIKSLAK